MSYVSTAKLRNYLQIGQKDVTGELNGELRS